MLHNNTSPTQQRLSGLTLYLIVSLLLLNVVIHLSLLHASPFQDEGCFASSGIWIGEGDIFYKDTWNERGPLIYFLSALWFKIAPNNLEAARILALILSSIQVLLLFKVARFFVGQRWALLAPLYYITWHIFFLGSFYLTEQLEGVLILVAMLMVSPMDTKAFERWRLVVAGLAFGLLAMDKQSSIFLLLCAVIGLLIGIRSRKYSYTLFLYFSGGVLLPWAILFIRYAMIGEVDTLLWGLFFPITEYRIEAYTRFPSHNELVLFAPTLFLLFVYTIMVFFYPTYKGKIILTFGVGLMIMASPSFFIHHMLTILLPASLAFAFLLADLSKRSWRMVFGYILVGFIIFNFWSIRYSWGLVSWFFQFDRWSEVAAISEEIKERTPKDDRIWIFPHESTIYLFADRKNASRYPFLLPWTASKNALEQIINDLETTQPKFVVYSNLYRDNSPGQPPSEFAAPVIDYLVSRYVIDGMTKSGLLLLRRLETQEPFDQLRASRIRYYFMADRLPDRNDIRLIGPIKQ